MTQAELRTKYLKRIVDCELTMNKCLRYSKSYHHLEQESFETSNMQQEVVQLELSSCKDPRENSSDTMFCVVLISDTFHSKNMKSLKVYFEELSLSCLRSGTGVA